MAAKKTFNYKLDEKVTIIDSKAPAKVVGRAHYTYADPSYYLRYLDGNGTMIEGWVSEDAIESFSDAI